MDAFLGNDELHLAEFRLKWMHSCGIRKVFIGEARSTFSGKPKLLHFSQNLPHLRAFHPNIEVIVLDEPESIRENDAWYSEEWYRNKFLEKVMERNPNSQIIFSDIDEIPSREQINHALESPEETFSLPMNFSYRRANWMLEHTTWLKAKIVAAGNITPNIRYLKEFEAIRGELGQHMSYLGLTESALIEKYSAFSHSELNKPEYSSSKFLNYCDQFGISHTGNAWTPGFGLLKRIEASNLTELQRFALEHDPTWFNFDLDWPSRSKRIVSSVISTLFLEGKIEANNLIPKGIIKKCLYFCVSYILIGKYKVYSLVPSER